MFDLCFGFKVPLWNEVVENPETKFPKTMKCLQQNFTGADCDFCLSQIGCGLNKGRDEIINVTTWYLHKAPLIYLLLPHQVQEHIVSFLCAVCSILHDNPLDDDAIVEILIQDLEF